MKLIVGLGNPGKKYQNTRHNVGFNCVDLLQTKLELPAFKLSSKFNALVTEGEFQNEKVIIAKPETFMNLSGESVAKLVNFYQIDPRDLILIYDDLDLPLGEIRIRAEGSPGTHNGMKSVVLCLSFSNFPRVRIGIESRGLTAPKEQESASFVLETFTKAETATIKEQIEKACQATILTLMEGVSAAQEKYNGTA
jgi:PTH1 family peptidyl-tRNA hydrolase